MAYVVVHACVYLYAHLACMNIIKCGYYSRAATIRGAATIRVNTVNDDEQPLYIYWEQDLIKCG